MSQPRRSESESEQDYGLPEGATFEPGEEVSESFDLASPHVMTVLGPVDPAALGVTLHAEHLIRRTPSTGDDDRDRMLDDPHATLAEIEDLHAAGGGALVDLTTTGEGRDIQALLWIAARAPAHLIAATGFSPAPTSGSGVDELASILIGEIRDGIDGTGGRAGLLRLTMSGNPSAPVRESMARAAGRAHRATGVPIRMDDGNGETAMAWIELLQEEGVRPPRIIVGHRASTADGAGPRHLLATGAFVSFDHVGHGDLASDERIAKCIHGWLDRGYGGQLLISQTLDRRSQLRAYGGQPGWVSLLERFTLVLMEAGIDAGTVRQLLVTNPQRALTTWRETTA